jgi:hypothetical protein
MKPMHRSVLIAGVIVLLCAAGWYGLRSRVRRANSSDSTASQQQPGSQGQDQTQSPDSSPAVAQLPAAGGDTISRNPPNGMIFAGSGKYQLYRQGDITWRLDTDRGWACILFATDVQWAKPRVFEHGCASPQTVSR